jgi:plasmid stabilization system protein ParE
LERVSEALDYISQYDSHASERWIEALFAKVEGAALTPRMGRIVPELGRDDIREVFYKSHRVVYKIKPEQIEILTVRHMRQQLDSSDLGEQGENDV